MTQMTQSLGARSLRLGHLGHAKNHDPNDPKHGHAGASLQIKNHDPNDPNDLNDGHAGASLQHAHGGRWPCRRRADGKIPTMPEGVPQGPAARA